MPKLKPSTLIIGTKTPGICSTCRHSNQGTADFREGHLFCWMDKKTKRPDQRCDVTRSLPRSTAMQNPKVWDTYYLYEQYDGTNCTYDRASDLRILAEDADQALRRSLGREEP